MSSVPNPLRHNGSTDDSTSESRDIPAPAGSPSQGDTSVAKNANSYDAPTKTSAPADFEVDVVEAQDAVRADRVRRRRDGGNALQRAFGKVVPYGSIMASGFTLASSSIGAGIISLPSAFATSGLLMALFYLFLIGSLTVYSYTLLGVAGDKTGLRSYEQIVRVLMGSGADYFLAFCMWFLSFGGEVSYVLSFFDVLKAFLNNADSTPHFLRTTSGQRFLMSMLWLGVMLPLTLPREINSLRYFSVFAIFLIILFVIFMVVHCIQNDFAGKSTIILFQGGNKGVEGLSIFMFAFISQVNAYEVYAEMYQPTVKRLTLSATLCVVLCFLLYLIAGLFGYLDFGQAVTGISALNMYNPIEDPKMGLAYAGIMLKLCVGYGMHMIPVREAIYHVCRTDSRTIPFWKHAICVISMATLSLLGGLFIPNINVVFGLVGGFSGGFIGFIFPALMFMYSGGFNLKSVGYLHYFGAYCLLIVGVVGVVFGTGAAIYGEAMRH